MYLAGKPLADTNRFDILFTTNTALTKYCSFFFLVLLCLFFPCFALSSFTSLCSCVVCIVRVLPRDLCLAGNAASVVNCFHKHDWIPFPNGTKTITNPTNRCRLTGDDMRYHAPSFRHNGLRHSPFNYHHSPIFYYIRFPLRLHLIDDLTDSSQHHHINIIANKNTHQKNPDRNRRQSARWRRDRRVLTLRIKRWLA